MVDKFSLLFLMLNSFYMGMIFITIPIVIKIGLLSILPILIMLIIGILISDIILLTPNKKEVGK